MFSFTRTALECTAIMLCRFHSGFVRKFPWLQHHMGGDFSPSLLQFASLFTRCLLVIVSSVNHSVWLISCFRVLHMNAHPLGTTEFCIHWIPLGGQCISQFCCVSYVSPLHLCTHKLWLPQSGCVLGVFHPGHFGVANALHWCISQFCWVIYVCFYICAHTLWLTHSGCAGLFYLGCFGVAMHRTVLFFVFPGSKFYKLWDLVQVSWWFGLSACPCLGQSTDFRVTSSP